MLGAYGGREFETPNLDRFAAARRCASTATTPARCPACPRATTSSSARSTSSGGRGARSRCGRRRSSPRCGAPGVTTMLVSDHPHLFETGGENYHTDFHAWDYQRGHESDPWRTRPDPSLRRRAGRPATRLAPLRRLAHLVPRRGGLPGPAHHGARRRRGSATTRRTTTASSSSSTSSTRTSRSTRPSPTPRCTTAVGGGPHLIWPPYAAGAQARACSTSARRRPGARPLRRQAHDDRRLVRPHARRPRRDGPVGRHRGDRSAPTTGTTSARRTSGASRAVPIYETAGPHPAAGRLARRGAPARCDALTTNVDIFATLCDIFGVDARRTAPTAGRWRRCSRARPAPVRD